MKKYAVIFALLICGVLITLLEVRHIESAREDNHLPVVVLKAQVDVGYELQLKDIAIQMVPQDLVPSNAYDDLSEVVGKTLALSLPSKTIVVHEMLNEKKYFMPDKGHSITAIKFSPEEVMCWEISPEERLEIIHVDIEGVLTVIGEVAVKGFYDQSQSSDSEAPIYLLVEGNPKVIEGIIRARGNGRIEAVKNN